MIKWIVLAALAIFGAVAVVVKFFNRTEGEIVTDSGKQRLQWMRNRREVKNPV